MNVDTISCASYCSWIYNYLCNQCLSPLQLRIQIPVNKTDLHDLTEISLKVALNTINLTPYCVITITRNTAYFAYT